MKAWRFLWIGRDGAYHGLTLWGDYSLEEPG